jgi:hypothetical protein
MKNNEYLALKKVYYYKQYSSMEVHYIRRMVYAITFFLVVNVIRNMAYNST